MSLAVASLANNSAGSTTSVTVTKPTGLAVGDLMLAYAFNFNGTVVVPDLHSGWTSIFTQTGGTTNQAVRAMLKVADASDVAASNFTFTSASTQSDLYGYIFRITTTGSFPANPAINTSTPTEVSGSTTNPTWTINFNTFGAANLMFGFFFRDNGSGGVSNYVISGTNPTWTEHADVDDAGNDFAFSIISATTGVIETKTQFELDTVESASRNNFSLILIAEQKNETGTNSLLEVSPTFFSQAGRADTNGTNDLHEVSPLFFPQSGRAESPTQWSNEPKPSTTWVNET